MGGRLEALPFLNGDEYGSRCTPPCHYLRSVYKAGIKKFAETCFRILNCSCLHDVCLLITSLMSGFIFREGFVKPGRQFVLLAVE